MTSWHIDDAALRDWIEHRETADQAASVELRVGSETAVDAYEAHGRISEGDRDTLLDATYSAWRRDVEGGKRSLMVAGDAATVADLNRRARRDRIAVGQGHRRCVEREAVGLDACHAGGGMRQPRDPSPANDLDSGGVFRLTTHGFSLRRSRRRPVPSSRSWPDGDSPASV